jgi:hypothetical protein
LTGLFIRRHERAARNPSSCWILNYRSKHDLDRDQCFANSGSSKQRVLRAATWYSHNSNLIQFSPSVQLLPSFTVSSSGPLCREHSQCRSDRARARDDPRATRSWPRASRSSLTHPPIPPRMDDPVATRTSSRPLPGQSRSDPKAQLATVRPRALALPRQRCARRWRGLRRGHFPGRGTGAVRASPVALDPALAPCPDPNILGEGEGSRAARGRPRRLPTCRCSHFQPPARARRPCGSRGASSSLVLPR